MKKPVAVVDNERTNSRGQLLVVRRFHSIEEAEAFVGCRPDKAKLERGGYGIDAPEEMVNPRRIHHDSHSG